MVKFERSHLKGLPNAIKRLGLLLAVLSKQSGPNKSKARKAVEELWEACVASGHFDEAVYVSGLSESTRKGENSLFVRALRARAEHVKTTWKSVSEGMSLDVKQIAEEFAAGDIAQYMNVVEATEGKASDAYAWGKMAWSHVMGGIDFDKMSLASEARKKAMREAMESGS